MAKSEITESFRQDYGRLPEQVKIQVTQTYRRWVKEPFYPSLHFKKVHSQEPIWSVRVGMHYRVVGVKYDERMIWFFVGTHAEYDQLLKTL